MNVRNAWFAGIGALALLGAALPLTLSTVNAQVATPGFGQGQPGQPGQPGAAGPRGGQGGPGGFGGGGFGGGFGGGTAMVEDSNFLYILQGGSIYKVAKGDLRVISTGELPRPQIQFQPGQGVPGGRGGQGGQGGAGGLGGRGGQGGRGGVGGQGGGGGQPTQPAPPATK